MTYTPKLRPRAHQVAALQKVRDRPPRPCDSDAFAFLMEMGTGKTKTILDEWGASAAGGDLTDLLVIAPSGSYSNWYEDKSEHQLAEIKKHLDPALYDKLVWGSWVSGGGSAVKKRLDYLLGVRDRPRALFVNLEALSTVDKARDLCRDFLARGRCYMAVDESTGIKNQGAARTQTVQKIGAMARARRIATGMVAPNSPMDLFSQFGFLDPRILGFRSFYAYRARYAILKRMEQGKRKFDVEVGYRNLEELQEKIEPYSYRVLKEDCLDIPPKDYLPVREVKMTDEQTRMYKELKTFATSRLDGETFVSAQLVITQMLRLDQLLCGHVVDEDGVEHDVPTNRVRDLVEVMGEFSGKAIIWTTYERPLHKIADALRKEFGKNSVALFYGGNRSTRGEDERRFLGDPDCRFMVSTQAAGARGNTWTAATLVVYYNNSYDLELRAQSEDRAHRDGQTRKVSYLDLVTPGTINVKVLKALRSKIDITTAISGENYREWLI